MRFSFIIRIFNFTIFLIFLTSLVIFFFWRFGIFKKESEPTKEIIELKKKIEFLNKYSFQGLNQYLQKLPTFRIEIPTISPEEIGRDTLF